ncbi:MAG: GIY-YIG nuclease family protein [Candidatus Zixiibacteriota bacterium]|nr:MAG: GIY-YIG nuclease family protein [candidate division Zixibacteria bacterium]
MDSGCYQLHLRLDRAAEITVGALGPIRFAAGYYIYTGRAKQGLQKRIARHRRHAKKCRWHVDYLLDRARIIRVLYFPGRLDECIINKRCAELLEGAVIVSRFGSSDCSCSGHLIHMREKPDYDQETVSR